MSDYFPRALSIILLVLAGAQCFLAGGMFSSDIDYIVVGDYQFDWSIFYLLPLFAGAGYLTYLAFKKWPTSAEN